MSQTVLITGASGGLGVEFAQIYARRGYNLVLVSRNQEKLEKLKKKLVSVYSIRAYIYSCDLSKKDAACMIYAFLQNNHLHPSILINNAGFGDFKFYATSDWQKQYDMIQVNITALTQLTRLCLPDMIKRGRGKILNVASIAAFEPGPCMSVYYATKAFVLSFTEALAVELRNTGITVTALCPGPTATGFETNANLGASPLFKLPIVGNAKDVARYGVNMLDKKYVVAIPGFAAKTCVFLAKLAPRKVTREFVFYVQRPR